MIPKRDISDFQWQQLRNFSNNGFSITKAAKAMGVGHGWLVKSAVRTGRYLELRGLFQQKTNVHPQLTDATMAELKRQAGNGVRKREAARAIGCSSTTLDKQAQLQGRAAELAKMFPHGGNYMDGPDDRFQDSGLHKADGFEISLPDTPATKWLTKSWRSA